MIVLRGAAMRMGSVAFVAAISIACARDVTPVDVSVPPDVPAIPDASDAQDSAADVPCDAMLPLGTIRWRTQVGHDRYLWGPMAADSDGNTYFVHDTSVLGMPDPSPYIVSLDACGGVRWRTPWQHPLNQYSNPQLMLSGTRLIAGNVDLSAFDAASGTMQWTCDLVVFAMMSGLGDVSAEQAMRSVVVDATGNAFVLLQAPDEVSIVRVDPQGSPSVISRLPNVPDTSTATDLVLDAQGQLEVPITDTNFNPGAGAIHSFARDGTAGWIARLGTVDYQDHLTVGSDFIVSGDTGTILSTSNGSIRHETNVMFGGPGATDVSDNIYMFDNAPGGGGGRIASFDRNGGRRWTTTLPATFAYSYDGGPLLGQSRGYYAVEGFQNEPDGGISSLEWLIAFDLATGAITSFTYPGADSAFALLTAGNVIFTLDGDVVAVSSGGDLPDTTGTWTTPRGANDRRGAARGH